MYIVFMKVTAPIVIRREPESPLMTWVCRKLQDFYIGSDKKESKLRELHKR
jgi:hypothetical protein